MLLEVVSRHVVMSCDVCGEALVFCFVFVVLLTSLNLSGVTCTYFYVAQDAEQQTPRIVTVWVRPRPVELTVNLGGCTEIDRNRNHVISGLPVMTDFPAKLNLRFIDCFQNSSMHIICGDNTSPRHLQQVLLPSYQSI